MHFSFSFYFLESKKRNLKLENSIELTTNQKARNDKKQKSPLQNILCLYPKNRTLFLRKILKTLKNKQEYETAKSKNQTF